ncbi:hypothetical protein [Parasphingopyxis marina]|uniref:Uncharacterized protein n=1 Tax=Parasphingopyxis marina TaxID=2761622 RepID=A0A842I188_9SPHN|nr:hypothetical protein [Parasphingopyxis marina]MBC2778463.1 hypothetical protein [Parasphingopyxis marina]
MAVHKSLAEIEAQGAKVAPQFRSNHAERPWELHPALFVATGGAYVAFLALLGSVTMSEGLVMPFAIFFVFLAAFFGVPIMFARVAPRGEGRFQSWSEFLSEGIDTASGRLTGRSAAAQVLVVPAMLVGWAAFVAVFVSATQ